MLRSGVQTPPRPAHLLRDHSATIVLNVLRVVLRRFPDLALLVSRLDPDEHHGLDAFEFLLHCALDVRVPQALINEDATRGLVPKLAGARLE